MFAQLSQQQGNEPESASERRVSSEAGAVDANGDDARVDSSASGRLHLVRTVKTGAQETTAVRRRRQGKIQTLLRLILQLGADKIFLSLDVCVDNIFENLIFALPVLISPHHLLRLKV